MGLDRGIEFLDRLADARQERELRGASAVEFASEIREFYENGMPPGSSTGWPSLDQCYTVVPGQFSVITGWPGSGKSEFLDAMLLNLARQGWRFALYSPENRPEHVHVVKFIEKMVGKPFGPGPNTRMTAAEAMAAADEIRDWFAWLIPANETDRTMFGHEDIMSGAESHFRRMGTWGDGKKGLVIDPWNELEHLRPKIWSETEYIGATLSRIRGWARTHDVHVWIVAHPQKLPRMDGKLPIPRPDSISGSQNWWNKADNALTVWRNMDDPDSRNIEIHVQKVRFKHVGRPGLVDLVYDRVTGRYSEPAHAMRAVR